MTLSPTTMRAIEACYDAAVDPTLWPSALQLLGESFGAQSCTFGTWDGAADPFRMPRSAGHEQFAELWINNSGATLDIHIPRGRRMARQRPAVILERDIVADDERHSLPYYGEIARPGDREWWAAACFRSGGRQWCLPLYRGAARGPFSSTEAHYAASAGAHLGRIVRLAERLADAQLSTRLDVLERFGCAAIVVGGDGQLIRANQTADRLMGTGVDLLSGRLVADGGRSVLDLRQILAAEAGSERPMTFPALVLRRRERPPIAVEIVSSGSFAARWFAPGRALLTLTELFIAPLRTPQVLIAAFGLTPAESLLATKLAEGIGIGAAARELGVGMETARTQLKSVFAKTGTRRQAELAALLARFR